MKTVNLLLSIFFLVGVSGLKAWGEAVNSQGFSLKIGLPSSSVPVEGPIPLEIKVTYEGNKEVEVISLDGIFLDLSFQTPLSWESRAKVVLQTFHGRLPVVTLTKGKSMYRLIYLHDFFSKVTPGKVELPITLRIWPEAGAAKEPVVLSSTVVLDIMKANPKGLESRIKTIASQISGEEKPEKRLELYRSLANLSHPDLIPVFLQALSDRKVRDFHSIARNRLVGLCETDGNWQPIAKYLIVHGDRADEYFFTFWHQKRGKLSAEQINELSNSSNLWIRLYTVKLYGKHEEATGLIASLEAEIEELATYVRRIKESNAVHQHLKESRNHDTENQ